MKLASLLCIAYLVIMLAISTQCGRSDNIAADTDHDVSVPRLIEPENKSEQPPSVLFRWHETDGTDRYHLRVSAAEDFSPAIVDSIVDSTRFRAEELPYDTTLYWKVRSIKQNRPGGWSDVYVFNTEAGPDDPASLFVTLQTPPDGATDQPTSPVLTWSDAVHASGYNIQLATDQEFHAPLIDATAAFTSYQASDLSGHETYYWRVEPVAEGRATRWSEVFSFTTGPERTSPPGDTLRIMPLGNSITEAVGYRILLWDKLAGAGYAINYVGSQSTPHNNLPDTDHEGHGGWYIGHIAEEVNGWLTTYRPDYILLMIGTNDIAWWTTRNGAEIADAHAALADQILANAPPHTWLLVASIPPQSSKIIEPNKVDRAQLVRDFNREMKDRMRRRSDDGHKIVFADIHPRLTTAHLSDGIHPNEQGYEIIAQAWFEALMTVLP